KQDVKEVRKCLIRALELEPKLAKAWAALAALDGEEGKLQTAAGLFRKAIAAKPDYAAAYQGLGRVLEQMGKKQEAMAAYKQAVRASRGEIRGAGDASRPASIAELEQKITPEPAAAELHYALATLTNVPAPALVPSRAVVGLFDKYADKFDD